MADSTPWPLARPPRNATRGRAGILAAALLALALLSGCDRSEVKHGAALYRTHCASCHGEEGRGQNPARPYGSIAPEQEGWIAPSLDNRGHCYLHTRAQLFSIIRDGSPFPGTPMKGFREKLGEGDVRALIAYIESLWDRNTRREYESREKEYEEMAKKLRGPVGGAGGR